MWAESRGKTMGLQKADSKAVLKAAKTDKMRDLTKVVPLV